MVKESFTKFWLLIENKKETKKRADWILRPVNKYHKKTKRILELGVGLGQVLVYFSKKYEVYGLDIKKEYVDIAKKRIPSGRFIKSSMHNFKINEKFDVIFSVYDSINFLDNFNQWKSTFKSVDQHLSQNGLFIFDMYTPKILKDFKDKKAQISKYSFGIIHDKPIIKNNTLTWDFKVFEEIKKGKFKLHRYKFKETIHPVAKVKSALSKKFKILETKLMDKGRRILFVCFKK